MVLLKERAVGGLRPTGGASETCLWKKVTEGSHCENIYQTFLLKMSFKLHGMTKLIFLDVVKPLLQYSVVEIVK